MIIISLLFGGCSEQEPPPEFESLAVKGMKNPTRYGDILIGGQPTEDGLEELAAKGYKTVLSTRSEAEVTWDEKVKAESLGMKFVHIPMDKPIDNIKDEWVDEFTRVMTKGEHPIVMHCGSGNRISGLWAVYLVEHEKVDPDSALKMATKTGMKGVRTAVEKRLGYKQP
jgi:uncharacterized protein (TIGR01244 family)